MMNMGMNSIGIPDSKLKDAIFNNHDYNFDIIMLQFL